MIIFGSLKKKSETHVFTVKSKQRNVTMTGAEEWECNFWGSCKSVAPMVPRTWEEYTAVSFVNAESKFIETF